MPRAKKLTEEQEQAAIAKLRELEFDWWYKRLTITPARKELVRDVGFPINASQFKAMRDHCRWFKVTRRKAPCRSNDLDFNGWQLLRQAVARCEQVLRGKTLDQAVSIVSTVHPCNRKLLDGLRKDLHFWND